MDMKLSESSVCLPLNAAEITQTSKNDDKKGPSKLYCQQNLETLPSGFKESENIVVEGKPNHSYSKLDAKTCDDNLAESNDPYSSEGAGNKGSGKSQCLLKDSSLVYHQDGEGICNISTRRSCSLSSQGQTVAFHELAQKPSCYFPVKSQNVGFAELSQKPSVCNDQPLDHYINYGVFGFSDHQISSSISSALTVSGKNLDCSQQKHFPHERMLQESIQQHQLSLDHDAPCTKGKMYNEDGERIKSDLILQENSSLAPFGAGCLYGKAVREVQGHSYSVEADEDEEVLPLSQPKYKPNQYIIAEMEGKQQSAHQEYFGDLTRRSSNLSFSDEREYINQRSMIEPSENFSISEGSYFDNEYEEHHVLEHDKRFPDFHEMRIRNRVPEPFTTTRSVYMGDSLESAAFCRISFQTGCSQKQNEHIYNSSQTQYADLLGQHENMEGAFSERNLGGHGNTAVHSYPSGNETLPRNMKLLHSDFENNLSKTTRKLLQGPFQFSSFGSYIPRPQQQRIRVGLAQPLRRNTTETEEQNGSEKSQMQQSFWTNGDSPPMDLESNPQTPISDLLKLGNDQLRGVNENKSGNRQIYVAAATPRQVRKLAYEKVHGVKGGQTKLVFK